MKDCYIQEHFSDYNQGLDGNNIIEEESSDFEYYSSSDNSSDFSHKKKNSSPKLSSRGNKNTTFQKIPQIKNQRILRKTESLVCGNHFNKKKKHSEISNCERVETGIFPDNYIFNEKLKENDNFKNFFELVKNARKKTLSYERFNRNLILVIILIYILFIFIIFKRKKNPHKKT